MSQRPVRVLEVIYRADRAGAETWLLHALRQINREDAAIDFVMQDGTPGAYDAEIQELGSRIFLSDGHRNLWRQFWRLRSVLRRHGPYDVIHSHVDYFGGLIMLFSRILGVHARIANFHTDSPELTQGKSVTRRVYIGTMKFLVSRFATGGLATSKVAAAALFGPDWHSDSRWRVHSACVDLLRFHQPVNRSDVRAELGIPSDAVVFGHVGRFVEQKNHRFLLRVAQSLARGSERATFVLVGSGPGKQEFERAVRDEGLSHRFFLLGLRDDISRLMKGAFDFFLFPSHSEGLGLALIEAQAAGLRCFASTAVPPEAIVIRALVQRLPLSEGPDCWTEAILQQIDTPNPITQEEALHRVGEVFDIRRNAAQLVEFYQKVTS